MEKYLISVSTIRILDDALAQTFQWLDTDARYTHSESNIVNLKNKVRHAISLLAQDIRDDISRKVSETSTMARESNTNGDISSNAQSKGGKMDSNTDG